MNQSKFSLADLLTVIGAFVYGFVCFLSFNFISLGNTESSLLWASVIALILGGLAMGAKLLKKTSVNFKPRIIFEWILLLLFVCASFLFSFSFAHFFSVTAQKESIQANSKRSAEGAEELFAAYEAYADNRLLVYKNRLQSVAAAKDINPTEYRAFGFWGGTNDSTQIENKLFILQAQLYPSDYEEKKNANLGWLSKAISTMDNWKPIGVVNVVNELEARIDTWKDELVAYTAFRAKGEEAADFDHSLTFENVSNQFTTAGNPTPGSIFAALLLYLLMLLSYFITRRHPRFPGLRVIFGSGRARDDDGKRFDNEW